MRKEILKEIADILIERAGAVFAFFADHSESEGIYDVSFFSDIEIDDYTLRAIEADIESLLGYPTEVSNLKECDTAFAQTILEDANTLYCANENEKRRFLASLAHEAELSKIKREILLARIRESGVTYEH